MIIVMMMMMMIMIIKVVMVMMTMMIMMVIGAAIQKYLDAIVVESETEAVQDMELETPDL